MPVMFARLLQVATDLLFSRDTAVGVTCVAGTVSDYLPFMLAEKRDISSESVGHDTNSCSAKRCTILTVRQTDHTR